MSIVSEAFRRLEAERAAPQAELRLCSRMNNPLSRPRRTITVLQSGTLAEMERAIYLVAAEHQWAAPRRVRGVLRIDVEVPMSFEHWSYYVVVVRGKPLSDQAKYVLREQEHGAQLKRSTSSRGFFILTRPEGDYSVIDEKTITELVREGKIHPEYLRK